MTYVHDYSSPVGKILLAANEDSLTGLWFYGAKYFAAGLESERTEMLTPVLEQTMQWLDVYFSGSEPVLCRRWRCMVLPSNVVCGRSL